MTRIAGVETEFGLRFVPGAGGVFLGVEEAAERLFRHRPRGYRSNNVFLPNGGRLYLDIGAHPEYATAECVTVRELVAQEVAGRALLAEMVVAAEADLAGRGWPGSLHVLANNTDSAGNTYGCHESYSVPRDFDVEAALPVLATFLATRPVLVGAGIALPGEGADEAEAWGLSPRAPHLHHLASKDTTGARALVNTRDEPHADARRWRRLHVTSADTTMAEPAMALRGAVMLLLLDALEAGEDFSDLVLRDPLATLASLGTSPWGDQAAATVAGRDRTAVDIQEEFLARLTARLARTGLPPALAGVEAVLTDLAPRVVAALRARDISGIDTEIDWAIKRRLLAAHRARHPQLAGEELRVLRARIELAFHDLRPATALAPRLAASGALATLLSAEERAAARTTPPETRAALRGRFVAACRARGADFAVSWDSLRLDSPPTSPIELPDPFAASHPGVDALVAKVAALRDEETTWVDAVGKDGRGAPG